MDSLACPTLVCVFLQAFIIIPRVILRPFIQNVGYVAYLFVICERCVGKRGLSLKFLPKALAKHDPPRSRLKVIQVKAKNSS